MAAFSRYFIEGQRSERKREGLNKKGEKTWLFSEGVTNRERRKLSWLAYEKGGKKALSLF